MPKPGPIPRGALREGIVACLSVATLRLEESDTALKAGLLTQAGIVFTFAVEEFGKAALLREALTTGEDDPVIVRGFDEHHKKIEAAGKHVHARYLRLTAGAFDPGIFNPRVFDTGHEADVEARWSGLFVDWDGRCWINGLTVDPATLQQSSRGLQEAIQKAMIAWT